MKNEKLTEMFSIRGGVCTTGRAQSPINVPDPSSNVAVKATTPFLRLPKNIVKMVNILIPLN